MSLSLSNSLSFASVPLVKIGEKKVAKISIFQTLNAFFCYMGVFFDKYWFLQQKMILVRWFFWHQSCLSKTPPTGFCVFSLLIFAHLHPNIFIYIDFWGVQAALFNILELYDQNPWRNNLSKLTTFDPILQRPHSAITLFTYVRRIIVKKNEKFEMPSP